MNEKNPVILYHAESNCPDGFGAAYAAWKKFGDSADYVPLSRGDTPPVDAVRGKDAYFVDFSYTKPVMDEFAAAAKTMTVLDHHKGVQDVIESFPNHVFDHNRSGAGIAWDYFHPNTPRPKLINHVEDDDLFRFALEDTREIITFLEVQKADFTLWDEFSQKLDEPEAREIMLQKARTYREFFEILANISVDKAKLVSFEGYEVYFATTHPLKSLKSLVGNLLARKKGPFALVAAAHPEGYGISIRGDGTVDVAKIAAKYGGNGHPNSAGFPIELALGPVPWVHLRDTDENPRD